MSALSSTATNDSGAPSTSLELSYLTPIDRQQYTRHVVAGDMTSSSSVLSMPPDLVTKLAVTHFDAQSFIESVLSPHTALTLDDLHSHLTQYNKTLHSSLVALINNEYQNFISLSESLTGIVDTVNRIEDFLTQIKSKLQAIYILIHDAKVERSMKYNELLESQNKIRLLKLLKTIFELVQFNQKQVKNVEGIEKYQNQHQHGHDSDGSEEWRHFDGEGLSAEAKFCIRDPIKRHGSGAVNSSSSSRKITRPSENGEFENDSDDDYEDDDSDADTGSHVDTHSRAVNPGYELFHTLLSRPSSSLPPSQAHSYHSTIIVYTLYSITSSLYVLSFYLSLTSHFAIIDEIKSQYQALVAECDRMFEHAVLRAIEHRNQNQLVLLLKIGLLTDRQSLIQSIIKEKFLKNHLLNIIQRHPLKLETNNDNEPSNVHLLFAAVMDFVAREFVLLVACGHFDSYQWHRLVLEEFVFLLFQPSASNNFSNQFFSPGLPTIFHYHYHQTQAFLNQYKAFFRGKVADDRSKELVERWFESDGIVNNQLLGKFNLLIYFRLRQQSIVTSVETELLNPIHTRDIVSAVNTIQAAVLKCWEAKTWLRQLNSQFLKLTIQLVQRLVQWASKGIAIATTSSSETMDSQSFAPSTFSSSQLLILHAETRRLSRWLAAELSPVLEQCIETDCRPLVQSLQHSLGSLLASVIDSLTSSLAQSLIDHLSAIQRLPSIYRMTSKQPTAPSTYIQTINKLLVVLFETIDNAWSADSEDKPMLTDSVLRLFYASWCKEISHVMEMAIKTEASLKLLKRNKNIANSVSESQDSDRIRMQLILDVTEFERVLREHGVATHGVAAVKSTVEIAGLASSSTGAGALAHSEPTVSS